MLSKNRIRLIKSLHNKKNRTKEQLFLAEGLKTINDCMGSFKCNLIVCTEELKHQIQKTSNCEICIAESKEIQEASLLKTSQSCLALFEMPEQKELKKVAPQKELVLVLDQIQDPGNMGTIIRLADWFGIQHLVCSSDTVDLYNPKVVQATMGAISRVNIYYTDLEKYLTTYSDLPIYGTFLKGNNIYNTTLTSYGFIIMGNEGNGISHSIATLVNQKLFIPNYPADILTSESLNVAVATAITCAEFRRRKD